MGFTRVKVRVFSPAEPSRRQEAEVLVDSDSLYSALPAPFLRRLGIEPLRRRWFKAFGGGRIERDMADMGIEYRNDITVAPVIFGEPDDEAILGVTALESLGYKLNPVTKELEPVELLML